MTASRVRTLARRAAPPADAAARAADAELLSRFLDARDEAAFAALVSRHLPTVRAVCRSVLRDPNDADDATQATFLVLVRRAVAVRDRAALGAWLARVAWRAANRLRETNARHTVRSAGVDPDHTPAPPPRPAAEAALHEEIARLPERYRLAVLTCYAAGTPTADAARRLGWPKGTLLTRLAWARRRLRARLEARGLAPAGGFAVVFAPRAGRAGAALLGNRIGRAGYLAMTGDPLAKVVIPGRVASLTEGVVRAMIGTKLKLAAAAGLAAVALLGIGLGRMTADPPRPVVALPAAEAQQPAARPAAEPPPRAAKAEPGDLVVRRPRGSYTREVPGYGKATFTFDEGRFHAAASVRVEDTAFVVTLDGDYAMNSESVVFGVISSAEVQGTFPPDEAAEIALIAGGASDVPFAFRVRVEDDAVTLKDIRFGAVGSRAFMMALDGLSSDNDGIDMVLAVLAGKYRADANPARPAPPAAPPPPARRPTGARAGAATGAAVPVVLPTYPGVPAQPGAPPPPGPPYLPPAFPN